MHASRSRPLGRATCLGENDVSPDTERGQRTSVAVSVGTKREELRRRRLWRLAVILSVPAAWMWWRIVTGQPMFPRVDLPPEAIFFLPAFLIILLIIGIIVFSMAGSRKSPHIVYLPDQIEVGFGDVKGMGAVTEDVRHTLGVLLDNDRFRREMGGSPRRGVLFEGPPGTGKTHMAKAMAKEAGIPFLFVSSTAFQSMWYGATAKKIRAYFRALRKEARKYGGAIGFIEEIDAIGMARGGTSSAHSPMTVNAAVSQDTGGVVNELLIQLQSFDAPMGWNRLHARILRIVNGLLPLDRQLAGKPIPYDNVLVIGATNRASTLDSALMRPGRFDRILHFGIPGRPARLELIDFFLDQKAHTGTLDDEDVRDDIAAATLGYSPAALERLFDEALLLALRDGRNELDLDDVWQARTETHFGLPEQVEYPEHERETIAIHEAGHATVAYLVGKGRRLEMLSIVKRREALGFLAHRMDEERFTQRQSELRALIEISLGGMVAEEMFFGESGTGPAGDLTAATTAAVEMVGSLGMGDSLVSFRALDPGIMGGNLVAKVLADSKARQAVDGILKEAKTHVQELLEDHRHVIQALADALLEHNELIDEEILDVIVRAEHAAGRTVSVDLRSGDPVLEPDPRSSRHLN